MAGGIFTDRPFHPNAKCKAFSFYSAMLYYGGGGRNLLLITLIFLVAYVLLAWYDYAYECNDTMYSGTGQFTFSPLFKPQLRDSGETKSQSGYDIVEDQEKAYLRKVYFFHAVVVAPTLIYAGYRGEKTPKNVFSYIGGLGALAGIYHGGRLLYPRK